MKVKSSCKPQALSIEESGNTAFIKLCENVREETYTDDEGNSSTEYRYDCYKLYRPIRVGLRSEIEENFSKWLDSAKQNERETKAEEIRLKRNKLLADTDAEATVDRLMLKYQISKIEDLLDLPIMKYRQALRDITKQSTFPDYVFFPQKPNSN